MFECADPVNAISVTRTDHTFHPARFGESAQADRQSQSRPDAAAQVRLAYLVSRYPAVSHTFILREIRDLRSRGLSIDVASVNVPDRTVAQMNSDEREEHENTYYLKRHGASGALQAHLIGLMQPVSYFIGLFQACRLGGWNLRRQLMVFFYFTEALMVRRWMTSRKLTHLHVHFGTAAANIALVLKRMSDIRLSMTIHGPDEFYDVHGQWLTEKLSAADFIVAISQYARSQIMQLLPSQHWQKIHVCRLGVDPAQYSPTQRPERGTAIQILCVGRLTPAKGQHILLDAVDRLISRGFSPQLTLVGSGPDEASLKEKTRHLGLGRFVQFTGPLNQAAVRDLYAQADVFALPSFAEGVPVVLMEAMASGIPCISTQITGIPELIQSGRDGLLITASDAKSLADALEKLALDPALREHLGMAGRRRVMRDYNLAQNVERLADVFKTEQGKR